MNPIHILLVEDNEGDVLLALEGFRDARILNEVTVASDGEQAMQMILQEGQYADYKLPDLILMDINLPKMDGKEVLSILKHDERFKRIPVIMLTTSDAEKDILESYQNYANCYLVKPVDMDKFMEVIHTIEDFWLTLVKLPTSL